MHGRAEESNHRSLVYVRMLRNVSQCAVAKSGMKCAAAGDPRGELLIDAYDRYRDQPIPYFYIARPLSVFLQTPQVPTSRPKDNYSTVFRLNAPLSFTATPFSVTIAVMSSAGVTSKLGL